MKRIVDAALLPIDRHKTAWVARETDSGTLIDVRQGSGLLMIAYRMKIIMLLALLFLLSGCTSHGDFGREEVSESKRLLTDTMAFAAASLRQEPVSYLSKTKAERRLYNLSSNVQASPARNNPVSGFFADAKRSRLLPADKGGRTFAKEDYHDQLMLWDWREEPESQYSQLRADLNDDYLSVCNFLAATDEVLKQDGIRQRDLEQNRESPPLEAYYVRQRVAENKLMIERGQMAYKARLEAYRYALSRLRLKVPSQKAQIIDRLISAHRKRLNDKNCHKPIYKPANNHPGHRRFWVISRRANIR